MSDLRKCCGTERGHGPHTKDCPQNNPEFRRGQAVMNQKRAAAKEIGYGQCITCGQPLGLPGGMAGTDLCGPCCTGEADTIEEFGDTW